MYVCLSIHNIVEISGPDSTVDLRLMVSAYWRDSRMRKFSGKNKVLQHDSIWHPQISVLNEDDMTNSLHQIQLLSSKTGLLRADYDLVGTVHNHMDLHEFPFDTDIISIELHCKGQNFVNLHTADTYEGSTECGGGRWEIFEEANIEVMKRGSGSSKASQGSREIEFNQANPLTQPEEEDALSKYNGMSQRDLEDVAERYHLSLPHHHLALNDKEHYRSELIRKIEEELAEEAALEAEEDDDFKNLFPLNMDGVHIFKQMLTLRDWTVQDTCAEELPGRNVAFMTRVSRKPAYYFWKIIFILHLLVFLTFTSFILPADATGIGNRIAISSTMFLALTSLAYVAAETLPNLEYLTSCDKLINAATIIVFAVNVWNCMLVMMWHGEGANGDSTGACRDFVNVATPSWLAWVDLGHDYELHRGAPTCNAQFLDQLCFIIFMVAFLLCDCVLFLPAILRRRVQKTLKQIVAEDAEFLEKRAGLSRSLSKASGKPKQQ